MKINVKGKSATSGLIILALLFFVGLYSTASAATTIIDNGGAGATPSPPSGSWLISGAINPYGLNSVYSRGFGDTYTYEAALTGTYDVSLKWTTYYSRCTDVPVRIYDGGTLLDTKSVNQQNNGTTFVFMGTYTFSGTARVVIESVDDSCSTSADAVEFKDETPPVGGDEVIVDNDGPGTSYSGGAWGYSSGADPYNGSSRAEKAAGAKYTFQASVTGDQTVSLWWTYWPSRCSSVPVDIYDGAELLATVPVNQQQSGLAGDWNVLGTYAFTGTARVVINAQSSCSANADAVRFAGEEGPVLDVDVDHIAIEGPLAVTENTDVQYLLRAYYTNGTDQLIPAESWDITCPAVAGISDAGLLSAGEVSADTECSVSAFFMDGDIPFMDSIDIMINEYTGPVEVIVDNDGPGTSYSGGEWGYSSGTNYYNSRSRAEKSGGAKYTFQAAVTGYQTISLWWTYWPSRCSSVPVQIYDGNKLLATETVDQQVENRAGRWNILGSYPFTGTARVVINAQDGCSACADAVRFELSEAPELSRIRIEGELVVNENEQEQYMLRADYTDGSNRYLTPDSWSVDCSSYASVSADGLVSAKAVNADKNCSITATYTEGGITETDTNDLIIKNIVKNGNILRHKFTVNLTGGGQIQPVMGDIDNDGDQEIVLSNGYNRIMAINGKTGAIEWSVSGDQWAVELADLNRDGTPEILFGMKRMGSIGPRVRALRGNGSILWTSQQLQGDDLTGFPITTADIDGDGYPEIYFLTEDTDPDPYSGNIADYKGALYMLDHNGNVERQTWVWHPCWGGTAIADYNNDGVFEIYVNDRRNGYHGMTESKGIQAYNAHTLEFLWGRPDLQHSSPHPVLADVLGDSNLEVVATEITLKGPLVLDPATGNTIPGYDYGDRNLPTHGTPTVYDIDGDGHLEYITSTSYPASAPKKFVVFDLIDGTVDFQTYFNFWLTWSPNVGDVTGDSHMEILAATGDQEEEVGDNHNGSYPLIIYDRNYNMLDWIDMPVGTGQLTQARVWDTDGDGYNEVVVAGFNGKLMVYDTDARTPDPAPRSWVQFYSEYRQGAAEYVPPPGF